MPHAAAEYRARTARRIGTAIRRAREAANISAAELARAIDVEPETVLLWERGARCAPLHQVWRVALALGVAAASITDSLDD